jgi:hypothetical protein
LAEGREEEEDWIPESPYDDDVSELGPYMLNSRKDSIV